MWSVSNSDNRREIGHEIQTWKKVNDGLKNAD